MTESNKIRLTVDELSQLLEGKIRVMSGFNGKVLCRDYKSNKHYGSIGLREVLSVWSGIETGKPIGFGNVALPVICVYADGKKEYEEKMNTKMDGDSE